MKPSRSVHINYFFIETITNRKRQDKISTCSTFSIPTWSLFQLPYNSCGRRNCCRLVMIRSLNHFPGLLFIFQKLGGRGCFQVRPLFRTVTELAESIQLIALITRCEATGPFPDEKANVDYFLWLHCISRALILGITIVCRLRPCFSTTKLISPPLSSRHSSACPGLASYRKCRTCSKKMCMVGTLLVRLRLRLNAACGIVHHPPH